MRKFPYKVLLIGFVVFQLGYIFLVDAPQPVSASTPFQVAYVTLGNSRFSFKGTVNTSVTASTLVISSSGQPDNDVGNLFPGDTVCFNGLSAAGCKNSMDGTASNGNYAITNNPNVANQTVFFSPAMTGTVNVGDNVISTQSGVLSISFKPTTPLASGDKVVFTIPAATASYADGIPDSAGFDAAALPADLMAGTGCTAAACFTPTSFTASAVSLSSASTLHTVTITLSSTLNATTTYSFTLGHASTASLRFLNPAPSGTAHVRGASDSLGFEISSTNNAGTLTYDDTKIKANPIDGVFVSATVEEALTYKINPASTGHVNASYSTPASTSVTECNGGTFTTTAATTPTAVNFGSITSYTTFYRAEQEIYVQTNASNGYAVTAQYNNSLKTSGGTNTIADGNCDGGGSPCSATTNTAWGTATNSGFGYTLGNITNSEASFTGATFKIFGSTPQTIMTKGSGTSGSQIAVCYQLAVGSTQATGYYSNKLTYIATPKF